MPKVKVDGIEVEVPAGATVLQACEAAGKEIPRFCYHERLSIAGNCRMCLVEVKPGPPKPQASCALPAADGQTIRTDTPMVKKLPTLMRVASGQKQRRMQRSSARWTRFTLISRISCGHCHTRIPTTTQESSPCALASQ